MLISKKKKNFLMNPHTKDKLCVYQNCVVRPFVTRIYLMYPKQNVYNILISHGTTYIVFCNLFVKNPIRFWKIVFTISFL